MLARPGAPFFPGAKQAMRWGEAPGLMENNRTPFKRNLSEGPFVKLQLA